MSGIKGDELVEALRDRIVPKLRVPAQVQAALAESLGCSSLAIYNWQKNGRTLGPVQIANIILKAQSAAQLNAIRPVVEFFEFEATNRKGGSGRSYTTYQLFRTEKRYESGLREQLEETRGVYVFYDSRGRALYVGKAADQPLWNELNNALNRPRDIQSIRMVKHPSREVKFRTSKEQARPIRKKTVKLHHIARYLSAYEVSRSAIGVFEAMLVRSFANDLLNVKMETFRK